MDVMTQPLITEAYRAINAQMHAVDDSYGRMGSRYVDYVRVAAEQLRAASILDYGCGKHTLRQAMPDWHDYREYDPALPGYDAPPDVADMVVCTDVMEHIEPAFCDAVLDDILRLGRNGVFFVIAMRPADKPLPDGTNPHKICEDEGWWLQKICLRWRVNFFERNKKRFIMAGAVR